MTRQKQDKLFFFFYVVEHTWIWPCVCIPI